MGKKKNRKSKEIKGDYVEIKSKDEKEVKKNLKKKGKDSEKDNFEITKWG